MQEQAPATGVDAGGALQPVRLFYAEGLPQARFQVIHYLFSRYLLYGGGEKVRAQAVVAVAGAGLVVNGPFHEAADPVSISAADAAGGVLAMAGVHGEKVADGDIGQKLLRRVGYALREEVHDFVVQVEEAFLNGKAHGRGGEGFAHGVHDVGGVWRYLFF